MSTLESVAPDDDSELDPVVKLGLWLRKHGSLLLFRVLFFFFILFICGLVFGSSLGRERLFERYTEAASASVKDKNWDQARICFERILNAGQGNDSTSFGLVLALMELGQTDRARILLPALAPLDKPGYAPAQVLAARMILASGSFNQSEQQAAINHLNRALQTEPKSPPAHLLLGQIHLRSNNFNEARKHFQEVAQERPQLLLSLASIDRTMGQESAARDRAERALKIFEARLAKQPRDFLSRMTAANSAIFLGDYARAMKILEAGQAQGADSPELRDAMSQVLIAQIEQAMKQPEADPDTWVSIMTRAFVLDGENPRLIDRVHELISNEGQVADKTREALNKILAAGQSPAAVHYLLGVDDWAHDRHQAALTHWEQAYEVIPTFTPLLNDLAWALANGSNPKDLPRALELSSRALDLSLIHI